MAGAKLLLKQGCYEEEEHEIFIECKALPHIRCIGESWPMTKEHAYFEASTLQEHGRLYPDHVPEVYHSDRTTCLMRMRYLEPPHIIIRKGLIDGIEYPLLAEHMSEYMAKTLFCTSILYPPPIKVQLLSFVEMWSYADLTYRSFFLTPAKCLADGEPLTLMLMLRQFGG